jgi:RNA-directed DNA polymerase
MQVIIFNERFFYKKILSSTQKEIKEIIETKDNFYTIKKIPKKNGVRTIACLEKNSPLAKVQKSIQVNFLKTISLPDYVYGFVPGYSYIDFLKPHIKKNII